MIPWLWGSCVAAAIGVLYLIWQSRCPAMAQQKLLLPQLPPDMDGMTLAHLTDLHSNRFGKNQERLLQQIAAQNPGLILFTGDLVNEHKPDQTHSLALLKGLSRIAPTYCVLGNHELRLKKEEIQNLQCSIQETGATLLEQTYVTLYTPSGAPWYLCGLSALESAPHSTQNATSGRIMEDNIHSLANTLPTGFHLLLSHHPYCCQSMAQAGFDLVLCGHSHGGQCRLPLLGPLTLPKLSDKAYVKGLYKLGATQLYISSGLGNSHMPLRTFNRVSWTKLTLNKGQ